MSTPPMNTKNTQTRVGELVGEGVTLAYRDGERTTFALRGVDAQLLPGRFYGIMGPSGSGKSSLLYVLSGLKKPTEGEIAFGDVRYSSLREPALIRLRRERFGFVFQQPFLLTYLSALENILLAAPRADRAARDKAMNLLSTLGLAELSHKLPSQLSGGEKQRVAVVRALMNDPQIIFADEPTAALDHANGVRVIDALTEHRGGATVVVVTHDPEMVSGADHILRLRDGERVE